jgi:hypothetical protein
MFSKLGAAIPRAKPQVGKLVPMGIPHKGMNARAPFAVMEKDYAISAVNVFVETFGLRSRKGYTEWANTIPGGATPVATLLSYYPATTDAPIPPTTLVPPMVSFGDWPFFAVPNSSPPAGKLFAAKNGHLYDITAGGVGPWTAQASVTGLTDYWTWLNFQNIAGTFLVACNDGGGYSYYDGAAWHTPTLGTGIGQISGCDPAKFCFVMLYKRKLWFIEKNSTRAWYLPVDQITGTVVDFDFGSQLPHGGHLAAMETWSMDSGAGMEDQLVAVASQGDVAVYKGVDPADPTDFGKVGTFYVGPLPVGRRQLKASGGDVLILSQFGLSVVSKIILQTNDAAQQQQHQSYLVDPFISRLMISYAGSQGWQVNSVPREEIITIGIPRALGTVGGDYLAMKTPTAAWSRLLNTNYAYVVTVGSQVFAGTFDGRVVKAYNGPLDNVTIAEPDKGLPIQCQVIPAYSDLGAPGLQKKLMLLRPTFLATTKPSLGIKVLTDYGPAAFSEVPTLPAGNPVSKWDDGFLWDIAKWRGTTIPIHAFFGISGLGFAFTPQLDYTCGGDTLLTAIDVWAEAGGVL